MRDFRFSGRSLRRAHFQLGSVASIQAVLDAGFIDALDIWGFAEQSVEVCFPSGVGPGSLLFLDATTAPRTVRTMPSILRTGMVCGAVYGPGTVVMVESWPGASMPTESPPDNRALQNCMVELTHILNFRDGRVVESCECCHLRNLTQRARCGRFKVDYHGSRLDSARYVLRVRSAN